MKNRIIVAVAVLAVAAGSGFVIKARQNAERAAERQAFVTDCRHSLDGFKARKIDGTDWVYDCVYRGALTSAEVTAATRN